MTPVREFLFVVRREVGVVIEMMNGTAGTAISILLSHLPTRDDVELNHLRTFLDAVGDNDNRCSKGP